MKKLSNSKFYSKNITKSVFFFLPLLYYFNKNALCSHHFFAQILITNRLLYLMLNLKWLFSFTISRLPCSIKLKSVPFDRHFSERSFVVVDWLLGRRGRREVEPHHKISRRPQGQEGHSVLKQIHGQLC